MDDLKYYIKNGYVADLDDLLHAKPWVLHEDYRRGHTTLHLVACNIGRNQANITHLLLTHGAKIKAQSDTHSTPLLTAAKTNADDVVDVLLKHGVSVFARNDHMENCLHRAFRTNNKTPYAAKVVKGGGERRGEKKVCGQTLILDLLGPLTLGTVSCAWFIFRLVSRGGGGCYNDLNLKQTKTNRHNNCGTTTHFYRQIEVGITSHQVKASKGLVPPKHIKGRTPNNKLVLFHKDPRLPSLSVSVSVTNGNTLIMYLR
jgi:hypothetical protein